MSPSDKTALRRVQRAGQRQRMREALAKVAASTSVVSAPEPQGVPVAASPERALPTVMPVDASSPEMQVDAPPEATAVDTSLPPKMETTEQQKIEPEVFIDSLLATALPSKSLTAEEFVEKICQLVDAYRAGLKHSQGELEPSEDSCCAPQPRECALDERKLVSGSVPECSRDRPVSPTACPYTVRNTFIDVLPLTAEISESQKAIFSTWPEDKSSIAEDELFSVRTNCTGVLDAQLEAGEIIGDYEEGELSDEEQEDQFLVTEVCAFTTGNWQSNYEAVHMPSKCTATSKMDFVEYCPKTEQADHLQLETEGLKHLLSQTLDGYNGAPWLAEQNLNGAHVGRWRKSNTETKDGPAICDGDSFQDRCTSSTSPRCVLSLESALLGGQQGGWFDVLPRVPWTPYA